MAHGYSSRNDPQSTCAILELEKENAVEVRGLECRDHRLTLLAIVLAAERQVLDPAEVERLPDERQRRLGL